MNVAIDEEFAKSKRGLYHLLDQQDVISLWIFSPTRSKKFHLDACRFAFYPQMIIKVFRIPLLSPSRYGRKSNPSKRMFLSNICLTTSRMLLPTSVFAHTLNDVLSHVQLEWHGSNSQVTTIWPFLPSISDLIRFPASRPS